LGVVPSDTVKTTQLAIIVHQADIYLALHDTFNTDHSAKGTSFFKSGTPYYSTLFLVLFLISTLEKTNQFTKDRRAV